MIYAADLSNRVTRLFGTGAISLVDAGAQGGRVVTEPGAVATGS